MEKATFGAGCFWGVELTFRKIEGVLDAAVGYMGGETENPTYEQVCSDTTGHAEVVQVEFEVVDEFTDSQRGAGGFGHTGKA